MAMGRNGAVSAPHLLASQAAIEVLASGGNAVDAAVTAAAVSTVVQPFSSSVAGLGWATVYDRGSGTTEVLQFHGVVPAGLDPTVMRPDGAGLVDSAHLEAQGLALLGSLVPGAVAGWQELLARKGTWTLARVLQRPIALARDGFAVSELLAAAVARSLGRLARWPESTALLAPGGVPVQPGDRLVQADLGATLQRIAAHGAGELVDGETAGALVQFYRDNGGVLSMADLAAYRPTWHNPLVTSYRGHIVHAAPAPLGDAAFVSGLQVLDRFGPFRGWDDPAYVHTSVEAAKLVAAERAHLLGYDTDRATIDRLLGAEHVEELRGRIHPLASRVPTAGRRAEDTITLAVVDRDGNAVHLMQTVGSLFGTGAIAGSTGLFTNSSLYFVYVTGGANRIVPGQPVEQNPCVNMVFDAGGALKLVAGSPGGKTRVETVRQMLTNVLDFGMNLQQAVDAPRFLTASDGLTIDFESLYGPVAPALRHPLEAYGHRLRLVDERFGTGQAVAVDAASGTRFAAADWRAESVALAY
jgi:gamma-glutamyltranspeptidase/glutathione hydrolase